MIKIVLDGFYCLIVLHSADQLLAGANGEIRLRAAVLSDDTHIALLQSVVDSIGGGIAAMCEAINHLLASI